MHSPNAAVPPSELPHQDSDLSRSTEAIHHTQHLEPQQSEAAAGTTTIMSKEESVGTTVVVDDDDDAAFGASETSAPRGVDDVDVDVGWLDEAEMEETPNGVKVQPKELHGFSASNRGSDDGRSPPPAAAACLSKSQEITKALTHSCSTGTLHQAAEADEDVCCICFESYTTDNPASVSSCGHSFHFSCLVAWQQRSNNCPLCMSTVSLVAQDSPRKHAKEKVTITTAGGTAEAGFGDVQHMLAQYLESEQMRHELERIERRQRRRERREQRAERRNREGRDDDNSSSPNTSPLVGTREPSRDSEPQQRSSSATATAREQRRRRKSQEAERKKHKEAKKSQGFFSSLFSCCSAK